MVTLPASSSITDLRQDAEAQAAALPPLQVEALKVAATLMAGDHGRRRAGTGESFWQFRPYMAGDERSQIDWRQSARSQDRLFIRQKEWETAATVWIWRDNHPSHDYTSAIKKRPTKQRRIDVLSTALCALLSRGGERVGLISYAPQIFTGRGAVDRFVMALETIPSPTSETNHPRILPLMPGHGPRSGVFLSDFFTPVEQIEKALRAAASHQVNGVLVQVLDPAEVVFPFKGRTEFREQAESTPYLFGDAQALSTSYKAKFEAHQSYIKDLCGHLGWQFISHATAEPAATALLGIYRSLAPEKGA